MGYEAFEDCIRTLFSTTGIADNYCEKTEQIIKTSLHALTAECQRIKLENFIQYEILLIGTPYSKLQKNDEYLILFCNYFRSYFSILECNKRVITRFITKKRCALRRYVTFNKLVMLEQLRLSCDFDPRWVFHTIGLVPHLSVENPFKHFDVV